MRKAVYISAFLLALLPAKSTSHVGLDIFDATKWESVIEYKSSATITLRKSLEEKAELYWTIMQKTFILMEQKEEAEKQRILNDLWVYQHKGYQCWLASKGDKGASDYYWKHLVPRAI
jgi:hypothetical protein